MARQKGHHTVTKALLLGFVDQHKEQVRVRSRKGADYPVSVGSASVVNDFYSFSYEGERDDAVEKWLATDVESSFGALLPALRDGNQPQSQHRETMARFVAVALIRTRSARAYMTQIDRHIVGPAALGGFASHYEWDLAQLSTEEITELEQVCIDLYRQLPGKPDSVLSHLRTMVQQSAILEERLLNYRWSVLNAPSRGLLVGDAPVVAFDANPGGWTGILRQGATVFMPLSPSKLLIGEPLSIGSPGNGDRLVKTVNALTVAEAFSDVFRHPETEWPLNLHLGREGPSLPTPTRTLTRAPENTPNTFPHTYPEVKSQRVRALLKHLCMNGTVG